MSRILWLSVASIHHAVAWGLLASSVLSVLYQPWYMAFLMVVVVARICTSRDKCVLTELENSLRVRSGMEPLDGGFLNHYYVRKYRA